MKLKLDQQREYAVVLSKVIKNAVDEEASTVAYAVHRMTAMVIQISVTKQSAEIAGVLIHDMDAFIGQSIKLALASTIQLSEKMCVNILHALDQLDPTPETAGLLEDVRRFFRRLLMP